MSEESRFTPLHPLSTAVLFLVFNRLDTTKQVFQAIRQANPPRLYIASDGARHNKEGEAEKVQAVREYIMQNIDWECEVITLFREENLGCKNAVSGAITWFFDNEEQGIILEDDCLPSQSFFWYCEELLEKYKDDKRVFLISGYNKQNEWNLPGASYFFSHLGGIWGWASWKRAWDTYDIEMSDIDKFIANNNFEKLLGKKLGRLREKMIYNSIIKEKVNTWDYQWGYARHKNHGLACVPNLNLIENIGFGADATHTVVDNGDCVERHEFSFPLKANPFMVPDRSYDDSFFNEDSVQNKTKRRVKKWLQKK